MVEFQIPGDVLRELEYEIARAGLECDSHHRAFRLRDKYGLTAFRKIEARGCCGRFECQVTDLHGDKWVVACNHGH